MYRLVCLIVFSLLFSASCNRRQGEVNKAPSSEASSPETAQSCGETIPPVEEIIFINADTVLVFPGFLSGIVDEEVINRDRVPLITTDGGESWGGISPRTVDFSSINFTNASQGWLVKQHSELWKTTDGGSSWTFVSKIEDGKETLDFSQQVYFADESNGWVLDSRSLWYTEDGGNIWLQHEFPCRLTDFSFRGKAVWVATSSETGRNNIIYRPQDGGESWEEIEVPNTKPRQFSSVDIEDLFFADEQRGWLANTRGVYRTDNGGKSWLKQSLPGRKILVQSLCFINEQEGWAAGLKSVNKLEDEAILLHTTDGGDTWQQVDVGEKQIRFDKVYFADSQNGWVVATGEDKEDQNANIYRTRDGGLNWKKVLSVKSPYESE
jgi:photosystem II stability/assembly factor-like uncharacterized protein